jgi:O-antigen/teichoic acid export membrane protein
MARAPISTQALRNFSSIVFGTGAGALNTLIVLPWAFSNNLADWGLLRIITAWAMLFAPIALFGASTTIVRFSPRFNPGDQARLAGVMALPAMGLLGIAAGLLALAPNWTAQTLGVDSTAQIWWVYALTVLLSVQGFLGGYLASRLKTSVTTFVKETFMKLGYLGLALGLGLGLFTFQSFLVFYVGMYSVATAILVFQAFANRLKLRWSGFPKATRKEILVYAGGIILAGSATSVVMQIDVLMVGRILGLDLVPVLTVGLFMGAVTMMPEKAWAPILRPLVADAFTNKDTKKLLDIHRRTHHVLMLGCGWILVTVMAIMPQIDAILPIEFRGLAPVVLAAGLAKWVLGVGGSSRYILAQSPHYKSVIWINWGVVVAVVPLNLWFMHPSGLGWGIFGAVAATLAVVVGAEIVRQILLFRYFNIRTFTRRSLGIAILLGSVGSAGWCFNPNFPSLGNLNFWAAIALKSILVTALIVGASAVFKLAPELERMLTKKFGRR